MNKRKSIIFLFIFSLIFQYCSARGTVITNEKGQIVELQNLEWKRCSEGQKDDSSCTGEAKELTQDTAKLICQKLNENGGYLGRQGWRLPNKEELLSIVQCSRGQNGTDKSVSCKENSNSPAVDLRAFPNTKDGGYHTSSSESAIKNHIWYVNFSAGALLNGTKTRELSVRCVRSK